MPCLLKSQTITYEPAGKAVKITVDATGQDRQAIASTYIAGFDGKDYPVKGSKTIDAVSLRRIDAFTHVNTQK